MRLHFAGNLGRFAEAVRDGPEAWMFAYGVRNRLFSYAEVLEGHAQHLQRAWLSRDWIAERERELKLYIAGTVRQAGSSEADYAIGARNRLLSYAFIEDWADLEFAFWVENPPQVASVFLDSGAFSAMSRGTAIDLGAYCGYIEQHEDALECYAALDVIKDWRATQRNVEAMVARGLAPVPTFHRGSPWEVLDELCAAFPYVALGGMVGTGGKHDTLTEESAGPHLDACWRVIHKHWPKRVHLFGVVAQWAMERYPFYSADSSSAIMGAGMGRVQRFAQGRLKSRPWTEDVAETWDGVVADGVGRVREAGGRSASAHAGRRRRNIQAMLAMERYLTDLWRLRGVNWDRVAASTAVGV